jgi:hypothetical protein
LGVSPITSEDGKEMRATGPVAGGGPTLTLRATRGDIVLRSRSVEKSGG